MNVNKIKKYISNKIGNKVIIVFYQGRNRKEKYKGYILKVYRKIFIIKQNNGSIKSFSYVDILTGSIRVYI